MSVKKIRSVPMTYIKNYYIPLSRHRHCAYNTLPHSNPFLLEDDSNIVWAVISISHVTSFVDNPRSCLVESWAALVVSAKSVTNVVNQVGVTNSDSLEIIFFNSFNL